MKFIKINMLNTKNRITLMGDVVLYYNFVQNDKRNTSTERKYQSIKQKMSINMT